MIYYKKHEKHVKIINIKWMYIHLYPLFYSFILFYFNFILFYLFIYIHYFIHLHTFVIGFFFILKINTIVHNVIQIKLSRYLNKSVSKNYTIIYVYR